MKTGRPLKQIDILNLIELLKNKYIPIKDIAFYLNCSRNTIYNRISKSNILKGYFKDRKRGNLKK